MTCLLCGASWTSDLTVKSVAGFYETQDAYVAAVDAALADAPRVVNAIARNGYPQVSVACARCSFVQVEPMPTAEEVAAYYASGAYRREFQPLPYDGVDPGDPLYAETLDRMAAQEAAFVCQSLQFVAPRRIHEVGCGEGRLSAAMAQRGHNVSAWDEDPGMRAAAQSRGVRTVGRIVGDERDAVIACQVLEHMTDPIATLTEWRAMLKPGGLLHVQVPTLEAMYGGAAHFFQRPHLVQFTRRTLLLTLYRAGFRPGPMGISGSVLWCTAIAADECLSYEAAVEALGSLVAFYEQRGAIAGGLPQDDVPALIAAHEATRSQPSALERWLAGGDASPEARVEVAQLKKTAELSRDAWIALSHALQDEVTRLSEAWSPDAWTHGYYCGEVRRLKAVQTVVDAQANQIIGRMEPCLSA